MTKRLFIFLSVTVLHHHYATKGQSADAGAIFGSITDKSGAVIPGTSVRITNAATGSVRDLKTNGSGFYSVEALPSGDMARPRRALCW